MRDECKKNADALRLLTTFLDKIERQMPRDSAVPQTRDDAEKQLRAIAGKEPKSTTSYWAALAFACFGACVRSHVRSRVCVRVC